MGSGLWVAVSKWYYYGSPSKLEGVADAEASDGGVCKVCEREGDRREAVVEECVCWMFVHTPQSAALRLPAPLT